MMLIERSRVSSVLLPGVRGRDPHPPVRFLHAATEVRNARRRAAIRDVADFILLLGVDVVFVSWPQARVPFTTRQASMTILVVAHLLVLASCLAARFVPAYRARRVAHTWSRAEREHFHSQTKKGR